jgi:hypothetical protein
MTESDLFERVGTTERGEVLVKDEAGVIFKLVPAK